MRQEDRKRGVPLAPRELSNSFITLEVLYALFLGKVTFPGERFGISHTQRLSALFRDQHPP